MNTCLKTIINKNRSLPEVLNNDINTEGETSTEHDTSGMFTVLTSLNFKLVTNLKNNMVKVPYMVLPCFTSNSGWWQSSCST
jgi:hypothetical protein